MDLSADGKTLLIAEQGDGGGPGYGVYLRQTDGSPAVRLGEGQAFKLSPDGKWVLVQNVRTSPAQLLLLPTGAGDPRSVTNDAINHQEAEFFPDGRRVVFIGDEPGRATRTFVQNLDGGTPRPVTREGVVGSLISPDSRFLVCRGSDARFSVCSIDGTDSHPIGGIMPGETPLRWSSDGRFLFVQGTGDDPTLVKIYRLDPARGQRELWAEITPPTFAGVLGIRHVQLSADGKSYVFGYGAQFSDLYLVEGLR
jgi:hypothetical protein